MGKKLDLTGQRFGRLTAVKKTGQSKNGGYVWQCDCDCGNTVYRTTALLTSGGVKSCGCYRREHCAKQGMRERQPDTSVIGERFERLVVVALEKDEKYHRFLCVCHCDCGNETKVPLKMLRNGNTKSCGCKSADFMKNENPSGKVENTILSLIASKTLYANNTSGARGVYWDKRSQRWYAAICFQKRQHHLGYFHSFAEAVNARKEAEETLFEPMLKKHNWKGCNE